MEAITNIKRSRAEWLSLVEQWRESGQTLKEFCQSNGLKHTQFSYYASVQCKQKKDSLGFAEVKTAPTGLSLRLCGQHELILSPDFDEHTLLKVLNVASHVQ
ncbi:IS66 family insertion sequence element accessory protein TnpA [Piscirickettsia litoralis]|uniref:Transposase n=1 Tax=Piscirickettsia litoralis TaxID=1891921 RepID=A0ABX2ZYA1_9GAMM|nr:hypothetical protein [Piscirickettsia litoralis]ODN41576.1 hypothetical protein BGC07_15850 [Piscirickettsia litoralis]